MKLVDSRSGFSINTSCNQYWRRGSKFSAAVAKHVPQKMSVSTVILSSANRIMGFNFSYKFTVISNVQCFMPRMMPAIISAAHRWLDSEFLSSIKRCKCSRIGSSSTSPNMSHRPFNKNDLDRLNFSLPFFSSNDQNAINLSMFGRLAKKS